MPPDDGAPVVRAARALGLAEVDVGVAVPDINASLNAVRDYKLTRDKGQR